VSSEAVAGKLVSVNVGLPREISWKGRTVRTAIWKEAVRGPRTVRRLNIDGDCQGDLLGHGGEQRAVFVYQVDSYRYWQRQFGRDDFTFGQFGENFTVEGLADDEVCIGDRYRIGTALFEVTQPRVTCYRVSIRMNEPEMPALIVSHRRPGFYLRVLREGEVGGARRDRADSRSRRPHPPAGRAGSGPAISFARSGLTVRWDAAFDSLLDLAEACDVPARWSCRTDVCHSCESGLLSGSVRYSPEPLEAPGEGNVLVCCSQPVDTGLVIDL
jgi:MOSC domain-containing protein YiiM/ferredoxin